MVFIAMPLAALQVRGSIISDKSTTSYYMLDFKSRIK